MEGGVGTGREYLGEFEQVVLLALARLEDGGYGGAIHGEILETSGRDVSIPSVYVTLNRLEKKGLVSSKVRPREGAGRARKVYTLQPEAHEALLQSRELLDRLWAGARVQPGGAG
jgi:DNA-binding PadR family transcriptional regulator